MTTVWNKAHKESFSVSNRPSVPSLVPIITENFESEDQVDNIKDLGLPEEAPNIEVEKPVEPETESNEKIQNKVDDDMSLLNTILVSLVSVFLTLHVAYTWYYNFTQCTGEATFYKKFDFLTSFSFITEYFYNIIKFIDVTLQERFVSFSKILINNTFLKDRSLFVLLLLISGSIVTYMIKFVKVFVTQIMNKKFNPKSLPGPNSLIAVLYFAFVLYGIFNNFMEGGPVASFMTTNPILSILAIIIRVALLYVLTTNGLPYLIFIYIAYYSLVGATAKPDSLYAKVADGTFIGHYRALHSIINVNHVVYEMQDNAPFKNFVESILRGFFKYYPYIALLFGLAPLIIKSLDFNMAYLKYPFIGVVLVSIISVIWLAIQENPKLLIIYNTLKA